MSTAIEVRGLRIAYGDVVAVDGLTFDASLGEVVALLGPNGAGKTSTVETLEGYRSPTAGTVRVLGLDPVTDHHRLTSQIGVMLQNGGVYTGMRPPEVLELFAAYYDDPADPAELLERVGLTGQRGTTWRHLSGGEQQRLSLALALVGRPKVAFLDEPTAGIDPAGRQLIRSVIAELGGDDVCILLTTHDLDEAERLADRVLIVDHGRLLASGTPAELTSAAGVEEIRFATPGELDVAALGAALGGTVERSAPGEYVARVSPTPANVAAITSWLAEHDLALHDLRAGRHTLEDTFLRLTASAQEAAAAESAGPTARGGRRRRTRR